MTMAYRRVVAIAVTTVLLAGCGSGPGTGGVEAGTSAVRGGAGADGSRDVRLVASFYPLQWVVQQITGAKVASLTKPGAEPHEIELAPRDVEQIAGADLVIYLKGFQPAVDAAVAQEAGGRAYDVASTADLSLVYTPIEGGRSNGGASAAVDPHFWLDPIRLAAVVVELSARLEAVNPGRAPRYRSNAAALQDNLKRLDRDYRSGLSACASKDLVTSHNAFGYLARRYGLTQVGITGLTPDGEPKPADLAAIASFVERKHVRTIYYETLVSPDVARTVGAETGASTALLDPIEGLTRQSRGADYLEVMRSNLATLRAGQPCR